MENARATAVDLFKLISSICVVSIHTRVANMFPPFINWFIIGVCETPNTA